MKGQIKKYNISKVSKIVKAGKTGLESVKNRLIILKDNNDEEIILIHDAVRIFVEGTLIDDVIVICKKHDVSISSVACAETLVRTDVGICANSAIDKTNIKRVFTLQTFKLKI